MRGILVAVVLVLGSPWPAGSQELASSFDQLRVLVKAGDTLTVAHRDGQETRGRMVRLTGTSLELDVDGATRLLQEGAVTTIRHRYADSLGNGAAVCGSHSDSEDRAVSGPRIAARGARRPTRF